MHSYASDSTDRQVVPWVIAVCAVGLAYAFSWLVVATGVSIPWWVEAPSIMSIYGLLHWAYGSLLWRRKILGQVLSGIPDCNGTWYGELRSSHEGGTDFGGMLVVHQTWKNILLTFRTDSSTSYSRMAAFNVTPGPLQGLTYEYTNDPRADAAETMHAHRGFSFLKLSADKKRLEGEYYSGRDRANFGTMRLQKVDGRHLNLDEAKDRFAKMKKEMA